MRSVGNVMLLYSKSWTLNTQMCMGKMAVTRWPVMSLYDSSSRSRASVSLSFKNFLPCSIYALMTFWHRKNRCLEGSKDCCATFAAVAHISSARACRYMSPSSWKTLNVHGTFSSLMCACRCCCVYNQRAIEISIARLLLQLPGIHGTVNE